jgi:hypothetical protein
MRTYDVDKINAATVQYSEEIEGFTPEEWLDNKMNIALINNNDDVALFEHQQALTDTVCGHYFFHSRGREAERAAKEFLEEIFTNYYVKTITGLTPETHKGALWMNQRLGFKEYGNVDTVVGPCRFVMLTKEHYEDAKQ